MSHARARYTTCKSVLDTINILDREEVGGGVCIWHVAMNVILGGKCHEPMNKKMNDDHIRMVFVRSSQVGLHYHQIYNHSNQLSDFASR